MKKKYILINCEGNILILKIDKVSNNLILCARTNDGKGTVHFSVSKQIILEYFHSTITLREVAQKSTDKFFIYIENDNSKYHLNKTEVENNLQCGCDKYISIDDSMKMSPLDIMKLCKENNIVN